MSWWVDLEYPPFEAGEDDFPRTGQVVRHYRENKRDEAGRLCTQSRMAEILEISVKTVAEIELRDASIDFDRRQQLCQYLDIPPILLGVRTRQEIVKVVEERQAKKGVSLASTVVEPPQCWWLELGYPAFAPGDDGFFPRTGQVVKHYRGQAMDKEDKPWTQRRLANALGIETDQAVWNLENRDSALDIERRRFLSDLFAIPPILFGIITQDEIDEMVKQRRAAKSGIIVVSTSRGVATSHKLTLDVEEYTALLDSYWKTFINNPTQVSMTNIDLCIDELYRELPRVRDQKPIQELLCRFHDLVANIWRDQQKYHDAMVQLEKALSFAERLKSDELKVAVLYDYGITLWQAGRIDKALEKYEEARRYERSLPWNLRDSLLLETGNTKALTAKTPEKKDAAIALVDQVGNNVRSKGKGIEADPYFLNLNLDRYHLARSRSLIAVGRNKEAIGEIELVKGGPEHPLRQAEKDIFEAQAHANLGEYSEAASLATSGLVVAQKINSEVTIALVESTYKEFPPDLFKYDDDVARLEYLLSKRKKARKR